jgi:hypothetical protein
MPSDFVRQVGAFLDLEAHGGGYADYALQVGYDFLKDENDHLSLAQDSEAIRIGELASLNTIRDRVLPDAIPQEILGIGNDFLQSVTSDVLQRSSASFLHPEMLLEGVEKELFEAWSLATGKPVKDLLQELQQSAELNRVSELRSPALHRFLLRKYLSRLDKMVADVERFERLPVAWDTVPAHLRVLLSNAHEAALLGQEIACAILCGTAIEESLRIKLGRESFEGLANGIIAGRGNLFRKGSPDEQAAWDVKEMRDEATHDPGSYLANPSRKKRDVLINARFLIAQVFKEKQ